MNGFSRTLVAVILVLLPLGAHAESPPPDTKADAPAAKPATSFGGRVVVKERLPSGDAKDFKKAGYDVVTKAQKPPQTVVDPAGKIYSDRKYQGIIPGIRTSFRPERFAKKNAKHRVGWIGFQQLAKTTRVFWQLTHATPGYEVTKVDQQTIEVFFPGGRVGKRNNRRYLYTEKFPGPVKWIRGKNVRRKGAIYTIALKRAARYTKKFDAPFLVLEFE